MWIQNTTQLTPPAPPPHQTRGLEQKDMGEVKW
jgi:hypothetical protein